MAYAAYRECSSPPSGAARAAGRTVFKVLDVTVPSIDACRVRRGLARCEGAGVLRCEPLVHANAASPTDAPRARLMIRLPLESYASVLHCLIECAPDGEIGHLVSWQAHLQRCAAAPGRWR